MGWSFPWASAIGTDFKHDFQEAFAKKQKLADEVQPYIEAGRDSWAIEWAGRVGVDWATYRREIAGISAFAIEDGGGIYYTYASYEQGLDEFSVLNRILAIVTMAES